MRKCRKCKLNEVPEDSRKFCDQCKLKLKACECGTIFRSKKHSFCKLCRMSKGNISKCQSCNEVRHIYFSSGICTTCYKFITKYNITIEELKRLRSINNCGICGIAVFHHSKNKGNAAVIDHDHNTGKVRGILCVQCNIIEGMIRDEKHLEQFYINYNKWISNSD
jgi:hypothetical protein